MILAVLFTLLFAISGICISEVVFAKHAVSNRVWLGLALGLLMLTWLPSLLAFLIGFTVLAQIIAAGTAVLLGTISVILLLRKRKEHRAYRSPNDWKILFLAVPILLLCGYLLHTHILNQHADGSLWVGQVTYGDLAMHLGFISSIAEQGTFPPQYSIFPGHALNYPFLCETSAASLYQLGASLRQAYIASAFYAFVLVVFGVFCFFKQWLKRFPRAAFATLLFFFGGGFGFFYFFDLSKAGGILPILLETHGQTVSQTLLDGFYQTPTNIPALGLRWVNSIVDMLIPQRATLFGWAFLFPCLYLLHGFSFEKKHGNVIPLAVIAGLLPMIHTHSFLALGIVSLSYFVIDLISVRFEKKRLFAWLTYGILTCLLAAPQLFLFTFRQTTESGMVRFHLNWANEADSYLWFYIKNLGLIFLLMPFAFLILPKRDKKVYSGAILLWLIAEFVVFQPNNYDNNKLLFIWFAFTCGLVSKLIFVLAHRASSAIFRKSKTEGGAFTFKIGISCLVTAFLLYFLFKLGFDSKNGLLIRPGTALTLFFVSGLLLSLCIHALSGMKKDRKTILWIVSPMLLSVLVLVFVFILWLKQYERTSYSIDRAFCVIAAIIALLSLILLILSFVPDANGTKRRKRFIGGYVALSAAFYLLIFTMLSSSVLTIIRECKSEYQVYTKSEAELSEQIKTATRPNDVILANSYHWNLITPLTGRSIVTGTGTFLYYHGINTSEREWDVASMYEEPAKNLDLFRKYGVQYVLVSNAERGNYDIDYDFFRENAEIVVQNGSGTLYRLRIF